MSDGQTRKRKLGAADEDVESGKNEMSNEDVDSSPDQTTESSKSLTAEERMNQFRALRLRAKDSKKQNRRELYHENSRMKEDPKAAKKLNLKKSIAEEKLAKLDALEAGEDFERKRAWDWTIEESQKWDERVAAKRQNEAEAGFADYTQEAAKQYTRNTNNLAPDLEAYRREQPTTDDSMVASSAIHNLGFIHQKPAKESIDKLVSDLSRADAARLKAQIKRGRKNGDEGDYINERNKVFNQKVSRFYDKYTKEMKDSFERGTAQ